MTQQHFHLVAEVSSDNPAAVGVVLRKLVGAGVTETPGGFHVGASTRSMNR